MVKRILAVAIAGLSLLVTSPAFAASHVTRTHVTRTHHTTVHKVRTVKPHVIRTRKTHVHVTRTTRTVRTVTRTGSTGTRRSPAPHYVRPYCYTNFRGHHVCVRGHMAK
jgi:hypothetical protein